jgi:hypothetical protein
VETGGSDEPRAQATHLPDVAWIKPGGSTIVDYDGKFLAGGEPEADDAGRQAKVRRLLDMEGAIDILSNDEVEGMGDASAAPPTGGASG